MALLFCCLFAVNCFDIIEKQSTNVLNETCKRTVFCLYQICINWLESKEFYTPRGVVVQQGGWFACCCSANSKIQLRCIKTGSASACPLCGAALAPQPLRSYFDGPLDPCGRSQRSGNSAKTSTLQGARAAAYLATKNN